MINKQIYFPGLNGVRFCAAFLVILDHLELFKGYFGFRKLWSESFSSHLGNLGVTIFFVLSGYLITYLLLTEKKQSAISIKNFYIRRALRIWPLYFFIVIISFFIVPNIDILNVPVYSQAIGNSFAAKLTLFLFFLANVAFVGFPTVAFGNILWSVAVEEQFYLIWPFIIKIFRNTFITLVILLILYMLIKLFVMANLLNVKKYLPLWIDQLIDKTRISCMIIGGLGALLTFKNKPSFIRFIHSNYIQITSLFIFVILLFNLITFPFLNLVKHETISVAIVIILINISTNATSILNLENRYFNYLGKISYGIYVYHLFAIVFCIKIFSLYYPTTTGLYFLWSFSLLAASILLTVGISHISYKYFESRILKKKMNYTTILSGDLVSNNETTRTDLNVGIKKIKTL